LYAIDSFIDNETTDLFFLSSFCSLPEGLESQTARATFVDNQRLVCNSKALDLERTDAPPILSIMKNKEGDKYI
jgi:hypothetical protein